MQAEIITIGDEILIGQIVDTNSAWMAQQLNLSGISVKQITSVSDEREHIMKALNEAVLRVDIILMTGGLGPTNDDITKQTLCEYFGATLRFDSEAYKNVEHLFKSRGYDVSEVNRRQAEVPDNCVTIINSHGTAPGMWFEKNQKIFISMPGVPYEMKAMMEQSIIPLLKKKFQLPFIIHQTILTQGIGESFLAEKIKKWENSLISDVIKLAYLPSQGMVRLRMSVKGENEKVLKELLDNKTEELKKIIPEYIYGYEVYGEEKETLEQIVGNLLRGKKKTLSTAESCTGGYLAHLITKIPGSSDYYKGSVISYSNEIKTNELGVDWADLKQHGAVSKQVVEDMAKGILHKFKTDYAIATSGIAGPSGGTVEKPVGLVWIAIATQTSIASEKFLFGDHRERNIHKSAITALNMLRKEILKNDCVE